MRLLTAGSLVRVQLGEPDKKPDFFRLLGIVIEIWIMLQVFTDVLGVTYMSYVFGYRV